MRMIKDMYYNIKYILQKIFRKGHYSDLDVISLYSQLVPIILPRLVDYRKNNNGIPMEFVDESKEDSGMSAWEEVVDKMIFAFEWVKYSEDMNRKGDLTKEAEAFYERWGIQNPWDYTKDTYKKEYDHKEFYHDWSVESKNALKAQEGLELFGRHFMSLWL